MPINLMRIKKGERTQIIEKMKMEELKEFLAQKKIRPSFYRLKIYHFLIKERTHPTADEIFIHFKKEIPSISRATIYNTLNLFLSKKIVQQINIEKTEARYDASLSWHGHFKCLGCGKIYDFQIKEIKIQGLEDFDIQEKYLFLEGKCPYCLKRKIFLKGGKNGA